MRAYKTVNDSFIEPVSFIVPRRAEVFQEDIYPPTFGIKPAMSSDEWFSGKDGMPPKISLESVYEGSEPQEVPSDYKPDTKTPIQSPPPTKTEAPAHSLNIKGGPGKINAVQESARAAREAPREEPKLSVQDNKASMASMADRVAAKDADSEEEDDEEDDDFEKVPRPAERPSATTARMEEKTRGPTISQEPGPSKPFPAPAHEQEIKKAAPSQEEPAKSAAAAPTATSIDTSSATQSHSRSTSGAGGPGEALKTHLQDIKDQQSRLMSMIEAQNRMMEDQTSKISTLTDEVEQLKAAKGGSGGASSAAPGGDREKELQEKIRRLELELEEARS